MVVNRREGRWILGMLTALLLALTPWPGNGLEGKDAKARDDQPGGLKRRPDITVRQGRLSVDLKEADLQEVLARIGVLTGITIIFESTSGNRLSAQFTDVELDSGLRRLLGLASLDHAIVYARGPAGAVAIKEVRVFGPSGNKDVPERTGNSDRLLTGSSPQAKPVYSIHVGGEETEAGRRFREAFEQAGQQGFAPSPPDASEAARGFRETLQPAREQPPARPPEEETEAARRFREAFESARQKASPPPGQESEAARGFREALERLRQGDQEAPGKFLDGFWKGL